MAEVDISLEGVPAPASFHHIPCAINLDGPAKISTYFLVEEKPALTAHFRGRQLDGKRMILPPDVQGLVLKPAACTEEEDVDQLMKVDAQFKEIVYW